MRTLRNIDYYGQFILGLLTILSVPVLFFLGFLAGLFLLGCWQLLSAVFNTKAFVHSGHSKQIWNYWLFCTLNLTFFFLTWHFGKTLNAGNVQVFYWITVLAAVFITVYYLKIYRDLIQFFELRDELDGLTKSKH